jgi:hypothetical protein
MLQNPQTGFDAIQLNGQLRSLDGPGVFDDFIYGITGNQIFAQAWVQQGTGSVNFNGANIADRPGYITVASGVANSFTILSTRNVVQPLPNGFWQYQAAVRIPVLSTGVDRFFARFGVMNSAVAADPTDGLYFEYSDATNAGNWTGISVKGGASSNVDSGVPVVAATFVNLKIQGAGVTSPVVFSINGVQVGSLSANIPVADITVASQLEKNAHTVTSNMDIDLIYFGYAFGAFR